MIDHLSYSSINAYHYCARSWRYHYIDKVPAPTAPALIFGGAFHNAIEAFIEACALGKACAEDTPALLKLWSDRWQEKLDRERDIDWSNDGPDELAALGAKMLSKLTVTGNGPKREMATAEFLSQIVPRVTDGKPEIERRIELHVPGVPVPIIGYIDIITADGVPCDFKTASRSWYGDKADGEMQPTFYLAALAQAGEPVPDGKFRYYVFTKTKSPKAQIIETSRTASDMFWLFEMVQETWKSIEAGSFAPNPTGWKCSEKYCQYWPICRGRG